VAEVRRGAAVKLSAAKAPSTGSTARKNWPNKSNDGANGGGALASTAAINPQTGIRYLQSRGTADRNPPTEQGDAEQCGRSVEAHPIL